MLVTDTGIVTLVRPVQSEKAPSPIWVIDGGMVMLVSPKQNLKASVPMRVTGLPKIDDGISTAPVSRFR
jgi:hypothetical protein